MLAILILASMVAGQFGPSVARNCSDSIYNSSYALKGNIVFLLDTSGSMSNKKGFDKKGTIKSVKKFLNTMAEWLSVRNESGELRAALVTFTDEVNVLIKFNEWNVERVRKELEYLTLVGSTKISEAIKGVTDIMDTSTAFNNSKLVILITDTEAQKDDFSKIAPVAKAASIKGVRFITLFANTTTHDEDARERGLDLARNSISTRPDLLINIEDFHKEKIYEFAQSHICSIENTLPPVKTKSTVLVPTKPEMSKRSFERTSASPKSTKKRTESSLLHIFSTSAASRRWSTGNATTTSLNSYVSQSLSTNKSDNGQTHHEESSTQDLKIDEIITTIQVLDSGNATTIGSAALLLNYTNQNGTITKGRQPSPFSAVNLDLATTRGQNVMLLNTTNRENATVQVGLTQVNNITTGGKKDATWTDQNVTTATQMHSSQVLTTSFKSAIIYGPLSTQHLPIPSDNATTQNQLSKKAFASTASNAAIETQSSVENLVNSSYQQTIYVAGNTSQKPTNQSFTKIPEKGKIQEFTVNSGKMQTPKSTVIAGKVETQEFTQSPVKVKMQEFSHTSRKAKTPEFTLIQEQVKTKVSTPIPDRVKTEPFTLISGKLKTQVYSEISREMKTEDFTATPRKPKTNASSAIPGTMETEAFTVIPGKVITETFTAISGKIKAEAFTSTSEKMKTEASTVIPGKIETEAFSTIPEKIKTEDSTSTLEKMKTEAFTAILENIGNKTFTVIPGKPETEASTSISRKIKTQRFTGILENVKTEASTAIPEKIETEASPTIKENIKTATFTAISGEVETEGSTAIPQEFESKVSPAIPEKLETEASPAIPEKIETAAFTATSGEVDTEVSTAIPQEFESKASPVIPENIKSVTFTAISGEVVTKASTANPEEFESKASPAIPENIKPATFTAISEEVETKISTAIAQKLESKASPVVPEKIETEAPPATPEKTETVTLTAISGEVEMEASTAIPQEFVSKASPAIPEKIKTLGKMKPVTFTHIPGQAKSTVFSAIPGKAKAQGFTGTTKTKPSSSGELSGKSAAVGKISTTKERQHDISRSTVGNKIQAESPTPEDVIDIVSGRDRNKTARKFRNETTENPNDSGFAGAKANQGAALGAGAIAGLVFVILAILVIIPVLVYMFIFRKKKPKTSVPTKEASAKQESVKDKHVAVQASIRSLFPQTSGKKTDNVVEPTK